MTRLTRTLWLAGVLLVLLSTAVPAASDGEDQATYEHMMRLASVLRCLQCQNQTLADSHADLALDLRRQMIEMIKQGKSDDEIQAYMVARYGEFVLYRPPFEATTLLLWLGPVGLVMLGSWLFYRTARQRAMATAIDAPLTVEQKRIAEQLLNPSEDTRQ